jgi:hypothetical protein
VVLVVVVLLTLLVEQAIHHLEAHRKDLQAVMALLAHLKAVVAVAVQEKQVIPMVMAKVGMVLRLQFQDHQ